MNGFSRTYDLQLDELVGQKTIQQRLRAISQAYRDVNTEAMPGHMLFEGPAGTGRDSFAKAFADSIQANWISADDGMFEVQGDLTAFLTNFKKRTVCLVENIEKVKSSITTKLAQALNTGALNIYIGQGPAAREHVMDLRPFTMIVMTNGSIRIPDRIRDAITFKFNFQRYSPEDLESICRFHAIRLGLSLKEHDIQLICHSSSGVVGNVVKSLKDISRFVAALNGSADISHALEALGIIGQESINSDDLQQLSGIEFERQICGLLGFMGFQTEMTRASGDGGIDIVAYLDQPIIGGRYLFQCKRFAVGNVVGASHLRDFFGALKSDPVAIKGVFVTTSSFTEQARQFAQQVGIELIDFQILSGLFSKYQS